MKFSKTYLQTMTDPSFPKEWREKGLEYKELKKLINGVVAELESLGLSADVLRELLEPPEQQQEDHPIDQDVPGPSSSRTARKVSPATAARTRSSHHDRSRGSSEGSAGADSDASDDLTGHLVAGLARLSTGRPAPSEYVDPLSPLMEEQDFARRRSQERAMHVPPIGPELMPDSVMSSTDSAMSNDKTDSPAGEWLSHLSHAHRSRDQRQRSTSRKSSSRHSSASISAGAKSESNTSEPGSSRETSEQPEGLSADESRDSNVSRLRAEASPQYLRASPMTMLGIRKQREESRERHRSVTPETGSAAESSAVLDGDALSPETSWRLGKKDLEELRRNSHAGGPRPSPMKHSFSASEAKRRASGSALGGSNSASQGDDDDERHDWGGMAWRERQSLGWDSPKNGASKGPTSRPGLYSNKTAPPASGVGTTSDAGIGKGRWVQGKDGRRARAEYELAGTPQHPVPRIRLIIESPVSSDDEGDTGGSDGDDERDDDDDDHFKMEEDDDGKITELPPSLPGSRRTSRDLSANNGDAQSTRTVQPNNGNGVSGTSSPKIMRTREIIIPLTADTQFLDTLTASLSKLSELQSSQKDTFVTSTEDLCASVARAASPYASKNDLYVWREIFQLWVDMQIFESQREKDRGELSVDESEARLKRFAEELKKRGWLAERSDILDPAQSGGKLSRRKADMQNALTLPMKDVRSVSAVEDFLRLNLALLDVKKFQRVNVEAARKILKKHDKRTALTASSGLRDFVRQQEAARMQSFAAAGMASSLLGNMGMTAESTGTLVAPAHGTHPSLAALLPSSTTGLLSESLPHILLSLLTTTLLPILPSVDDYSCAICTGLAWRPIRLDCSHLFCIRCLVKLQKAGKADCPLCRAKNVVQSADGRNLDEATVNMLRLWFPQEVGEKDKENESDRKQEELRELGFEGNKCAVM